MFALLEALLGELGGIVPQLVALLGAPRPRLPRRRRLTIRHGRRVELIEL